MSEFLLAADFPLCVIDLTGSEEIPKATVSPSPTCLGERTNTISDIAGACCRPSTSPPWSPIETNRLDAVHNGPSDPRHGLELGREPRPTNTVLDMANALADQHDFGHNQTG